MVLFPPMACPVPIIAGILLFFCVSVCSSDARNVTVGPIKGKAPKDHIEIVGVEAAEFDPGLWQGGKFNLVPDYRFPFMPPQEGPRQNIYAPSAVQTREGYRLFYGAWDGIPEGKDRIYSGDTDPEFLNINHRHSVALPGSFQHVCNVNAIALNDGAIHFVATVYPLDKLNKPAFFRSDSTGTNWNGTFAEPYTVHARDFITIHGYTNAYGEDAFAGADINGMNVILHEDGFYRLYFGDFKDRSGGLFVYRASSREGTQYTFEGKVLEGHNMVNDVKRFQVGTNSWYLLGSHHNRDSLSYSISTNPLSFPPANTLFKNMNDDDRYIVALGWVVKGDQQKAGRKLLGVLYGAGPVPSLDRNKIFARWLQKKIVFVTSDGTRYEGKTSFGPNRQLISLPGTNRFSGIIEVYGDDGTTLLGRSKPLRIRPGQRLELKLGPDTAPASRR